MQGSEFQLAAVHGMLYTGGNVVFSPDGAVLYSPVHNYMSAVQLQAEGIQSLACSNSSIQCCALSPDGDLLLAVGHRGLGFFFSVSARVILDTISFPPSALVACVSFSPCGKFVALAFENTLQVYNSPTRRVVQFHGCHRVENYHNVLSLPIKNVAWTADGQFLLVSGEDARMRIVPRQLAPHKKGMAAQHNDLIGHRTAVMGAWFLSEDTNVAAAANEEEGEESAGPSSAPAVVRVVSVAADNVAATWRRTTVTRREVLHAIARAQMNTKLAAAKRGSKKKKSAEEEEDESDADEEEEDEDEEIDENGEAVPLSFLEKQKLEQLQLEGVSVSNADDTVLPDMLRYAFELEKKYMLTHKGNVSVTAFHQPRGLVAIGYNTGIFAIHTVGSDTFDLVHLLSISAQALTAACFSPSGDHVAFGSEHLKQLLVWNWKSESYALKEQAHYYDIARTAMTADSRFIISGGDDGKVKVWNSASGQCYVTFTEHTAPITGIVASAAMTTFFTSSLDGTARAYDLVRYRQFRVFTPPEETQLSCVAVDGSGELLAVGSSSLNRIYLFAVQTGRVVDTLQGHEGPIACLAFHPSGTTLASGSLDHNIVFWDLFNQNEGGERLKGEGEVLHIHTEVLCVAYSSSGRRMAVLTSSGEISVYDTAVPAEPELIKTFQTNFDAAGGWEKETGPNSANYNAHFTTVAFSPEGERLVAGGESKWIVMYHALQGYVVRKWPVTTNLDVLGAEEQYQWRQISEGGFLGDIDIEDDDAQLQKRKLLELPGSRHRHHATGKRKTERAARTAHLCFAATGTEFAAATTDGLLLFSTRHTRPRFLPLQQQLRRR